MNSGTLFIGRDALPGHVVLDGGQSLNLTLVALPGVSGDFRMDVDINGPLCELDIAGLYLCTGSECLSLHINIRHNAGGSRSRQLFKGIVGGSAKAAFDGLIYVERGAQGTRAYQENHSILLSDAARAESLPQLEIYADDVECSHGSTSGALNPDEEFYLRSRGIPEAEARRLQKIAFLAPVASRLDEQTAAEIYSLL